MNLPITSKDKGNGLGAYGDGLRSALAIITLIVVILSALGSFFQLARFLGHVPQAESSYSAITTVALAPLITIGGGFAVGLLTAIGQSLTHSERIIRAGALGILCNLLYVPLFGYVLLLSFRSPGFSEWLTNSGPFLALLVTVLFALLIRRSRVHGRRILMIGFSVVIVATLTLSFIESVRYDVPSALLGLIPVVAAAVIYALQRSIGKLTRSFNGLYNVCLIVFGGVAMSSFAWDNSFDANSITGVAAIVVAVGLLAASLYIYIRLRIVSPTGSRKS